MAEGRRREAWNHTAQLLAMLYNAYRGRGAKVLKPQEFHPLEIADRQVPIARTNDLSILKHVFVERGVRDEG